MSNDEKKIEQEDISVSSVEEVVSSEEEVVSEEVTSTEEVKGEDAGEVSEAKEEAPVKEETTDESNVEDLADKVVEEPAEPVEDKAEEKVPSMDDFKDEIDASLKKIKKGDVVDCKVESITESEIVVSFDYSADGVIKKEQLLLGRDEAIADKYKVGDELKCLVINTSDKNGNVVLSHKRAEQTVMWEELEQKFKDGQRFEVKIAEVVKGGLIARLKGIRAFMPASMSSNNYVEDLNQFVGKDLLVVIKDFDRAARKVIISHKEVAQELAGKAKEEFYATVAKGDLLKGKVKKLMNFGAFVDLGAVDGLMHVNEMSWRRLKHPSEVVKVGQEVEVEVINVDTATNKISLRLAKFENNPWETIDEKYKKDEVYTGTVVRLADFGAFVRLEDGIEGLVHISEISNKHIDKPSSVLKVGDEVKVKVLSTDKASMKISLSIKAATYNPEADKKPKAPKAESQFVYSSDEDATTSLSSVLKGVMDKIEE